jgi:hypothetical protein
MAGLVQHVLSRLPVYGKWRTIRGPSSKERSMAGRKSGSQRRNRRRLSPSTRAGAYVREEIRHAREGKHPVKNRKQAVAISLSKARRKGIRVPARKS